MEKFAPLTGILATKRLSPTNKKMKYFKDEYSKSAVGAEKIDPNAFRVEVTK